MSGYNGRRGPNLSTYVANLNNLNTIPSDLDLLAEPTALEDDLAVFTGDLIDWDAGSFDPDASNEFGLEAAASRTGRVNTVDAGNPTESGANQASMDFNLNGDFQFADFGGFSNPIVDTSIPSLSHSGASYPVPPSYTSPVSTAVSPVTPGFDHATGKKRKMDHSEPHSQHAIDEAARVAAEEDKRRRNTAASARFRVKKKQREQALEKTAKEMTERVSILETRVKTLETENAWLKGLITEKNGGKADNVEENAGERSTGNRTDGVGTEAKETKA